MGNHRAEHRSRASSVRGGKTSTPGRRRAEKVSRGPVLRLPGRLTAMPFVGLAALAVAGAGAIGVNSAPDASATIRLSAVGTSLTGTDAVGFAGDPRERAISRDSERQALQDAADVKLKAAAEQDAAERNAELKSLGRAAEARAGEIAEDKAKKKWVLPLSGYRITARFGSSGSMWSSTHTGLDMAAPDGTQIVAIASGVVTEAGWAGPYGNRTVMTLADGTELWYNHQSAIGVRAGQKVTAGQPIGAVGATGNVTGPHLHLEVRPGGGDPVDPERALITRGLTP